MGFLDEYGYGYDDSGYDDNYDVTGLRKRNIFNIQNDPYDPSTYAGQQPSAYDNPPLPVTPFGRGGPQITAQDPEPSFLDTWNEMMGHFNPKTAASEKYNQLLGQFPQQRGPGIARGLAGIAAALGGQKYEDIQKEMYAPYMRDVATWKEQVGPAYNAAQLEQTQNANDRTMMSNMATAAAADAKNRWQAKTADEKNRIADEKVQTYNEIQRLKILGQQNQYTYDTSGPTVIAMRKGGGPPIDTGVKTGKMNEVDKIELQNVGKVEAARQFGQNQQDVEWLRRQGIGIDNNGNYFRLDPTSNQPINPTVPGQVPQGAIRTVPQTGKGMTPREIMDEEQLKLGNILRYGAGQYPEIAEIIIANPDGSYTLGPRPVPNPGHWPGGWGADPKTRQIQVWDMVAKELNPNYQPPQQQQQPDNAGGIPGQNMSPISGTSPVPVPTPGRAGGIGPQNIPANASPAGSVSTVPQGSTLVEYTDPTTGQKRQKVIPNSAVLDAVSKHGARVIKYTGQ